MERRELEHFRGYLLTLARIHFHRALSARADPSDIVQETLLEAHRSRERFRGSTVAAQAAWLRRILAANLNDFARNHRRACRDVQRERSLDEALDASSQRLEAWARSTDPSPSSVADRQERILRIATALADLTEEEQDVLVLRYCEDLSLEEIGARLGVSRNTIARRLRRGSAALRERLLGRGSDDVLRS
jgi:RNA polymerase sigma-70 factor (ECF subfamily)